MTFVTTNLASERYVEYSEPTSKTMVREAQSPSKLSGGDNVFSYGLNVLFLFMEVLSEQANAQYSNMEAQSAAARKAQEHAATVDGQIADLASGKTTTGSIDKFSGNIFFIS